MVNPWVHDFAAFDLWSKPLGLLHLASGLRNRGYGICFLDCLDVHHPQINTVLNGKPLERKKYGTGKFFREIIKTPPALSHIKRPYSRYGLPPKIVESELRKLPEPSAIMVTSLMTYWYPGVIEAIEVIRRVFPKTPVILGGIYARLCEEHATKYSGADYVLSIKNEKEVIDFLSSLGIAPSYPGQNSEDSDIYPSFDLLNGINYVCITTSRGCPYKCAYCATNFLNPKFVQKNPRHVYNEIVYWHNKYDVQDYAFYDDALLVNSERHFIPLAKDLINSNIRVRFHTPNALHIREITPEIAALLKKVGFVTIRLGLETSDFNFRRGLDTKVSEGEFEQAVKNLLDAGFKSEQIGTYILTGLPHQTPESVLETINFVGQAGAMPYLAEYSPIPHTGLWEKALKVSEYDLAFEPLFHNNTILPCWDDEKRREMAALKKKVLEIRQRLRQGK